MSGPGGISHVAMGGGVQGALLNTEGGRILCVADVRGEFGCIHSGRSVRWRRQAGE